MNTTSKRVSGNVVAVDPYYHIQLSVLSNALAMP
jgi:hypothetical protein